MLSNASIINVFRISLAIIVVAASASSLSAFCLLESSAKDTKLINTTTAIRINTYKFTTKFISNQQEQAQATAEKIQRLWESPVLSPLTSEADAEIKNYAARINREWQSIVEEVQNRGFTQLSANDIQRIDSYVDDLNELIKVLQAQTEQRILTVRIALALAPLVIALMVFFLLTVLKRKIDEPLTHLLSVSKQLGRGDFTAKSKLNNNDEIGQLAQTLNEMSETASYFYGGLERRVEQQTEELSRKNKVLSFLYDTARSIIEYGYDYSNYQEVVERLYEVGEVEDIELCLLTEEGNRRSCNCSHAQILMSPVKLATALPA